MSHMHVEAETHEVRGCTMARLADREMLRMGPIGGGVGSTWKDCNSAGAQLLAFIGGDGARLHASAANAGTGIVWSW